MNVKAIAFDFVGVIATEKDLQLTELQEKIERKFGVINNDRDFLDWTTNDLKISEKEATLNIKEIISSIYEIREPEFYHALKKYKLAIASNHLSYLSDWLSEIRFLDDFELDFNSSKIGLAKPDIEYFEQLAKSLGVYPNEILFFDDKETNVVGAKKIGIQAYLYNKDKGALSEFVKKALSVNR